MTTSVLSLASQLATLPEHERDSLLAEMPDEEIAALEYDWQFWGRPNQLPPTGVWKIWLILAGRGFGKSRAGAEQVLEWARAPGIRIALVAETAADARDVLVEGESGILACSPPWCLPKYEPSKRRVTWANGTIATTYSGDAPDQLRGPQHHKAWCLVGETMVLMGDGSQKQLANIRAGDLVSTRDGPRVVLHQQLMSRNSTVYLLQIMDGRAIIGTGDHPVWVDGKGFTPLSCLVEGDSVCVTHVLNGTASFGIKKAMHAPFVTMERIHTVALFPQRRDVYNITVEGAHEFFANGILTHNCDEAAKWKYATAAWDMMELGLRLGDNPQVIVTTTPRPIPLIQSLLKEAADPISGVVVTRGSTYENYANLARSFIERVVKKFEGTRLGRQELHAELLSDTPGALWTRELLEQTRVTQCPPLVRIVVGLDPGGDAGIVVAGLGEDRHGYVLEDLSLSGSPDTWAAQSIAGYHKHHADCLVPERNHGGEMVATLIRTKDPRVAVKTVWASHGKYARAEPVSSLYEQKKVHHVGMFALLEDEFCDWVPGQGMPSPNRLDAAVWALTDLMLGPQGLPAMGLGAALDGLAQPSRWRM